MYSGYRCIIYSYQSSIITSVNLLIYIYRSTACCGLHVMKNIESQFVTSVMQEHIVPSARGASIADVVDRRRFLCQ